MLSWGFRVRRRTVDAVFRAAGRKAIVEGRKAAVAEGREPALNHKRFEAKKFKESVRNLQDKDQDLATALMALRLVRLNGYKGATHVSVETYKVLVEACIGRDEYVAAVLAFEMMIEDWAGSLSPPTTPPANAPSATTPSPAVPSSTPVSLSAAPGENADKADSAFLTPVQFADLTHGIFNTLCGTFKRRLWSAQPVPDQTPEDMAEAKRYQFIIIKSIAVLVSLLDKRHLPYYNIRKLLELMYMCTRTAPRKVYAVTGGVQKRMEMRLYVKRVAASLVNDLGSRDISPIPEISQMLRWRDTLLPHFNLYTYHALLDLVYHALRSATMGAKLIKIMAEDGAKMRIALDKEVCLGLVAWPTRLRMMGLDTAVYNYLWNTSGLDPQPPTLFAVPHNPEEEPQAETERLKPQIFPEVEPNFDLVMDLKLQLESYEASRPLPIIESIQEE
jgi:hypothetical protein